MHDSRIIANEFLKRANDKCNPLTTMQLLKLVYISHGWMLGLYGFPLINDKVEAWKYGPVIPDLYRAIKKYRDNHIIHYIDVPPYSEDLEEIELDLIDQVYNIYGNKNGIYLSTLTHQKGTPWEAVYKNGVNGIKIPNDLIESHYSELSTGEWLALDDKSDESEELRRKEIRDQIRSLAKKQVLNISPNNGPSDDRAKKEAMIIASGEGYEALAKKNEHDRKERFKDAYSNAGLCLFWLFFTVLVLIGVTWVYHLLLPLNCHYLENSQISKLEQLLFSGVLSSIATNFASNHLKKEN